MMQEEHDHTRREWAEGKFVILDDWLDEFLLLTYFLALAVAIGAASIAICGGILVAAVYPVDNPASSSLLLYLYVLAFLLLMLGIVTIAASVQLGRYQSKRKKLKQRSDPA